MFFLARIQYMSQSREPKRLSDIDRYIDVLGAITHTINHHVKKVLSDSELQEDSVIRNFRITAADGKVTAEIAKAHAESEFEKYRLVQDWLFESDFDRVMKQIESGGKPDTDGE